MGEPYPRVVPFGESAYLVEFGAEVDLDTNARVHTLAQTLDEGAEGLGIGRTVPSYASLLVPFFGDVEPVELAERLSVMAAEVMTATAAVETRTVEVPVMYGYDDGPDLADVAAATGISPDSVIDQHAGAIYRVYMLGFSPGFAYLGPLPEALRMPRRSEPRVRVPAGSVAIAGAQTAVYPHSTPGGWHIIGRSEAVLWDPSAPEPARLRPGDDVRFVPA